MRGQEFMAWDWVTWQYFCSLASVDHVKLTSCSCALPRRHSGDTSAQPRPTHCCRASSRNSGPPIPGLTKRALDHTIWLFERVGR